MYEFVVSILAELGRWVDRLGAKSRESNEKLAQASAIFRRAITETQLYLGRVGRTNEKDSALEEGLARLWSEAAGKVKDIDKDVSHSCYKLSRYWAESSDSLMKDRRKLSRRIDEIFEAGEKENLKIIDPRDL